MDWFKVDSTGWLRGSIRADMNREQRSIWIDLLAFANECKLRDGTFRFAPGKPMPREYIAQSIGVPLPLLNEVIAICQADKNINNPKHRVEVWDDGTVAITNWERYQSIPAGKQKPTAGEKEHLEKLQLSRLTRRYSKEAINILSAEGKLPVLDETTGNVIDRRTGEILLKGGDKNDEVA